MYKATQIVVIIGMFRLGASSVGAVATFLTLKVVEPCTSAIICFIISSIIYMQVSASFIINDYFDIEQDLKNHPERALPRNLLNPNTARNIAISLFMLSSLFAIFLDYKFALYVIGNNLLFYSYSVIKKRWCLLGNFIVCYAVVSSIILPAIYLDEVYRICPAAVILFIIAFIREIVLDIWDVQGDNTVGVRSLAATYGAEVVFKTAWMLVVSSIIIVFLMVFFGAFKRPFVFIFSVSVCLLFLVSTLWKFQNERSRRSYILFRYGGFIGLIFAVLGIFGI